MNDKDLSSLNEAEFDLYLQELSDVPPPPAVSDELSPWRTAMSRIVWGIGWSTITLNFLWLDVILPAVGLMMLLLGFRCLRRENRWFAVSYGCAWVKLLWWLGNFAVSMTVFKEDSAASAFQSWGTYLMLLPNLLMFLGLRNGIRAVQRKAGLSEEGGTGLLICEGFLIVLGLIRFSGWPVFLFFVVYILTLRELYRTSKTMEEAGYAVSPAPVRVSDSAAKRAWVAAIAVTAVICYVFLAKYPMDWKRAEAPTGAAAEAVRQELLELGFPAEILDDLTEEEVLACSGADFVLVESAEHLIEQPRGLKLHPDDGQNTLRITHVGIRFPGERGRWKLLHHFQWLTNDGFCGTEALQLWPAYQSGYWVFSGDFSGRVLYDNQGTTFASGYHFLGTMNGSSFLGPTTDVFATFSLPSGGENHRGYLIYEVTAATMPSLSVHSWFNYVHQYSRLRYPVQTAMESELTGTPNFGWGFRTEQTEFQFFTHTDIPGIIGGNR